MVTLDYILIAIVLLSAIVGLVQGFLKEVCSLVTWVLAIWLAWHFGPALVPHLGGVLEREPYGLWAGRAIVFVGVLVAGAIVGFAVNHFVRLSLFSGLDRMLGFILGLLRGIVIVGFVVILAQSAKLDGEGWWQRSKVVPVAKPVASALRAVVGEHLPDRPAQPAEG
jgi:membrane protein required for colicin V production